MAVQVKSERLLELVDESAEVEQIGTGFTFTEGPIWNPRASCSSATCPATCGAAGTSRTASARSPTPATRATG